MRASWASWAPPGLSWGPLRDLKKPPRGPNWRPRVLQEAPKKLPGGAQEAPRGPQEAPGGPREAPKRLPGVPRGPANPEKTCVFVSNSAFWALIEKSHKNLSFFQDFGALGGLPGALWGPPGSLRGPLGGLLRASWASWSPVGPSWGPFRVVKYALLPRCQEGAPLQDGKKPRARTQKDAEGRRTGQDPAEQGKIPQNDAGSRGGPAECADPGGGRI